MWFNHINNDDIFNSIHWRVQFFYICTVLTLILMYMWHDTNNF